MNKGYNVDSPSYNFTKLDVSNAEHKEYITDFLKWEGDFKAMGGLKFKDGKVVYHHCYPRAKKAFRQHLWHHFQNNIYGD